MNDGLEIEDIIYDKDGLEISHQYHNGMTSYKLNSGYDIILYDNGTYYYPNYHEKGTYVVDDLGNFVFTTERGEICEYNYRARKKGDIPYLGDFHKIVYYGDQGKIAYDKYGKELYHIYDNGQISYKLANGKDIILSKKGEYFYPQNNERGTYTVDDEGNLTCVDRDGFIYKYNHTSEKKEELINIISDDDYQNHRRVTNINGRISYSKINHIEFAENTYNKIITTLYNLNDDYYHKLRVVSENIDSTINNFYDTYSGANIGEVENSILLKMNDIKELKDIINYSILAYQACDINVGDELNKLVDSLFDDDNLANVFKENIKGTIELDNKILRYKEDTYFVAVEEMIKDRIAFDNDISRYLNDLNPERFGLDYEETKDEFYYIEKTRGRRELINMFYTINVIPYNYMAYVAETRDINGGFKPSTQQRKNSSYEYKDSIIGNYQTNSEMFNINGHMFEIAQVLPQDCTNFERFIYNGIKAQTVNTLLATPNIMLEHGSKGSNVIVLTCDPRTQNKNFNLGYYVDSGNSRGTIVIDAHSCFMDGNDSLVTSDIVLYELGQKFDDMLEEDGIASMFGRNRHSDGSKEWGETHRYEELPLGRESYRFLRFGGEKNKSMNIHEMFAAGVVEYLDDHPIDRFRIYGGYDDLDKVFGNSSYRGSFYRNIKDVESKPFITDQRNR